MDANEPNFDGNAPLDLGDGKRMSLSPENKRSGMAATAGSPVNNPLLAGLMGGQKKQMPGAQQPGGVGTDLLPAKVSGIGNTALGNNAKAGGAAKDTKPEGGGSQESDSFYKMYNKEIKVNQDEIPIILAELTDAAFNFITRENYEKALILLQKTEGVLEVVSLEGCSRDKYVSFITYNNMSMCFQKLGMLEECIFYLKQSIALVSETTFFKNKKISQRNRRVNHECKLKLQLCAILSQNQNHSEALDNARKSVRLSHQMFKDMEELCQIYIDKINYRDNLLAAQEQSDLEDAERVQLISMVLESSPAREIPKHFLEQSISLVERSSLKMFPVIREVRKRVVNSEITTEQEETKQQKQRNKDNSQENSSEKGPGDDEDDLEEEKPDMRSVLGFLNQNEWIYNLNIGNIMQIQPLSMKEFLLESNDETELSRDSFLSKLSILIVTYFCMSTEMRFLLQSRAQYLKAEVKKERELESEFWHAKALEIACTFLPSECPLLNHVLLSYQKHHDPSMQPIKEDEESQDVLQVLRPLKGIEQSKYQPIVRDLSKVKVNLSPQKDHVPLKDVLRQFNSDMIDSVINFNGTRVKKIAEITDKEVQVALLQEQTVNNNSPTQANLSAIVIPQKVNYSGVMNEEEANEIIGVVENSNILPLSLNESRADGVESGHLSHNSQPTSTQKLKQEMYLQEQSLLEDHQNFDNDRSGIEGLEQQLMEAVKSPSRQNNILNEKRSSLGQDFQFDSRDASFVGIDQLNEEDTENKMYDLIISKVLGNPKIDKRTLLQKFISKIEMESNMNGGLASELSQIKQMMNDSTEEPELVQNNNVSKIHAVSQIEQPSQLLHHKDDGQNQAQSMQQINVQGNLDVNTSTAQDGAEFREEDDSEIMLNVAQETMAGQTGVQDARASRDHKRLRQPKPMSAKPSSQSRDQQKSRIDTSMRTRSSSHHMKSNAKQNVNQQRKNVQGKATADRKDFRKVKSYLEDESLFKDIERSTEYQDPLNLNVEQSIHTDTNVVDVEEIQLEQKSSQKSQSRSNSRKNNNNNNNSNKPRHHSSVQSTDPQLHRNQARENQTSSNQKSHTFSRPSTAVTNATRHSSVNLRRARRQNAKNQPQITGNPQKTLIAKELEDPSAQRSESSSRGRFQNYRTRMSQNTQNQAARVSDPKENVVNFSQNAKISGQQRLRHSQARKRLSVNHHQSNIVHGQSVEHHPAHTENRGGLNKVSQKRLGGNKHHNLSVQHTGPQGGGRQEQHHMTSKIKKLVSHKQIETNIKRQQKYNKQKLSQTKNVLQQNKIQPVNQQVVGQSRGRQTRQRKQHSKSKSKSKSKSRSRSSGQRTYSGSSKHLKSRSNHRSGSDNRRNLLNNELAQYSFDLIDGDQVNINAHSVQQLITQHSKNDLQRQVLENQKIILSQINQKRTNSNDSRKSRSQNRKKSSFTAVSNMQDLMPKKQQSNTQSKIQRLSSNNNLSMHSQAQILLQAQALPSQPSLKFSSNQTQIVGGSQEIVENENQNGRARNSNQQILQNSASQHVQGLSNFIKQINQSKRSDQQVNKSMQYLKKQQKVNTKGQSQPARSKAAQQKKSQQQQVMQSNNQSQMAIDHNKSKHTLMKEIKQLQNRLHNNQQNESSPIRARSGSQKRSGGDRSHTRSRSRSPSQPTKAIIPKKKSFNHIMQHSKNMNFTTNEVGQFNESLLNMSSGKQMKPSNRAHATSKLEKRKHENLITNNGKAHHHRHQADNNNVAYTSFEEAAPAEIGGHKSQLTGMGQQNAHHSLSMFDSEVSVNKVNQFAPLHHQLSQNAILAPQTMSQNYILGQQRVGDIQKQQQISSNKVLAKQVKLPKRSNQNLVADKQRNVLQNQSRETGNYRTNPQLPSKQSKQMKN